MDKTATTKRNCHPLRWFWTLCVLLALLTAGGVFLCRQSPRAYQPRPVEKPEQVSLYLTHQLGPDFYNQVQLDEPFELRVQQDGLNDILRNWPWPQKAGNVAFSDPVVLFEEQVIYLMGTLEYKGISTILTIIASPVIDAEGNLSLNIDSIWLGKLPAKTLITNLAQYAFQQSLPEFENEPQLEEIVRSIIYGQAFNSTFEISGRNVKVTQITLESKLLTLQFDPE